MSTPIPTGSAKVAHEFQCAGDQRTMAITYAVALNPGETDFTLLPKVLQELWLNKWSGLLSHEYTLTRTTATPGNDSPEYVTYEYSLPTNGSSSKDTSVPSVACLIRKITDQPGRRGRGRLYQPGVLPEDGTAASGVIASNFLPQLQAAATSWLNGLNAQSAFPAVGMQVLHSSTASGGSHPPATVTSLIVEPLVATQRRRIGR